MRVMNYKTYRNMTFILQSGVLLHWYLIVQRRGLQDKVALCRS